MKYWKPQLEKVKDNIQKEFNSFQFFKNEINLFFIFFFYIICEDQYIIYIYKTEIVQIFPKNLIDIMLKYIKSI